MYKRQVLLGVLISLFLVVFCWKPYYLFRKALKQRLKLYIIMYVKHLSVAIVSIILDVYKRQAYTLGKWERCSPLGVRWRRQAALNLIMGSFDL